MQLPIKLIIVAAVVVLVLASLSLFFLQSTGSSLSKTEAERIFSTDCLTYSQRECDWEVTHEPEFENYLKACRTLYGSYREAYSCLYSLCSRCFESMDLKCSGLCSVCSGHDDAGVDRETCCLRYKTECQGSSVDCTSSCPGL